MKLLAYLLAILCAVAAVMYFAMPASSLPEYVPGYIAGSDHIHVKRAAIAAVAAVVFLVLGRFAGGSRR